MVSNRMVQTLLWTIAILKCSALIVNDFAICFGVFHSSVEEKALVLLLIRYSSTAEFSASQRALKVLILHEP